MNRTTIITGIMFLSLLLCSCDPPHTIHFENNSNSELNVLFVFDTTASHHNFHYFKDEIEDTLNIKIQPGEEDSIYFGIGTWSDKEVRTQAKSLQSFTLENDDFKTQFKTKKAIENFLKAHVVDDWGWDTEIKIEVD